MCPINNIYIFMNLIGNLILCKILSFKKKKIVLMGETSNMSIFYFLTCFSMKHKENLIFFKVGKNILLPKMH